MLDVAVVDVAGIVAVSLRIRGTRFWIRCSRTLTRDRMSETICIPLERVTSELVEAADASRGTRPAAVTAGWMVDEDAVSEEGR